jgi:peptidoglycan/LPS O-acetylase OafA/YrhL
MIASPAPKMQKFDAMRGIAALLIAACHAGLLTKTPQRPCLALEFCFVLSGFVIANAYYAMRADDMTIKEFIGRRLLRLYPLFAFGLALCLVVALIDAAFSFGCATVGVLMLQFITALLVLPYPAIGPEALIVPQNAPYWSLTLEMQLNVIFAIAIAWFSLCVVGAVATACGLAIVGISYAPGTLYNRFLMSD